MIINDWRHLTYDSGTLTAPARFAFANESPNLLFAQLPASVAEQLRSLWSSRTDHAWRSIARSNGVFDELESFRALEDNWDGEGALPLSSSVIDIALVVLRQAAPMIQTPEICPNPNGTISLFWSWRGGRAELEVGRTRHSWVVVADQNKSKPTYCSGQNEILVSHGVLDLLSAIALHQEFVPTEPTTKVHMHHSWGESLAA